MLGGASVRVSPRLVHPALGGYVLASEDGTELRRFPPPPTIKPQENGLQSLCWARWCKTRALAIKHQHLVAFNHYGHLYMDHDSTQPPPAVKLTHQLPPQCNLTMILPAMPDFAFTINYPVTLANPQLLVDQFPPGIRLACAVPV